MMDLKKYHFFLNKLIIAVLLIMVYGFFFVGAYFSHPNAEDFSLCGKAKHVGIIDSILDLLVNYDGRYFTNFLHVFNPFAWGQVLAYPYIIGAGILFIVFSTYYLLSSFKFLETKKITFLFSASFILLVFTLSASIVHLLYWLVSSIVYLYSIGFYLLYLGSLIRALKSENENTTFIYALLSSILLICSIGMNEIFLVIHFTTLVVLSVYIFTKKLENKLYFLGIVFIGLIAILFFVSNPGLANRFQNQISTYESFSLSKTLLKSIKDFNVEYFRLFTSGGILLLFTLLWYPYLQINEYKKKISAPITIATLLFGYVVLWISSFAFYIPMGHIEGVPFRIFSLLNFGMLAILLYSLCSIIDRLFPNAASFLSLPFTKTTLLLLLGFTLFLSKNNFTLILNEFNQGVISAYHQEMQARYQVLLVAKKEGDCWEQVFIKPLQAKPISIYHLPDISPNRESAYWNEAYENYFAWDEVSLTNDTIFKKNLIEHY